MLGIWSVRRNSNLTGIGHEQKVRSRNLGLNLLCEACKTLGVAHGVDDEEYEC